MSGQVVPVNRKGMIEDQAMALQQVADVAETDEGVVAQELRDTCQPSKKRQDGSRASQRIPCHCGFTEKEHLTAQTSALVVSARTAAKASRQSKAG